MPEKEIKKKVIALIAEHFGMEEGEITPEQGIRTDLTESDIEIADFFQKLESEFKLTISMEDEQELHTVGDIITYITDNADDITED